jgi:hypothetical protein
MSGFSPGPRFGPRQALGLLEVRGATGIRTPDLLHAIYGHRSNVLAIRRSGLASRVRQRSPRFTPERCGCCTLLLYSIGRCRAG